MICHFCHEYNQVADWKPVKVKCISSSCSETQGRECPDCGKSVGHIWLDGQPQWRTSGYYKPSLYTRVVTPTQYERGWFGFLQEPLPMILVRKLEDGNYLVREPKS